MAQHRWDAGLYEAQHSFVWQMGSSLVDQLAPQPGEHVLDVGCGTGQLTAAIAELGAETMGVDASPEMIGQARQNFPAPQHPRLRFLLVDAQNLSFQGEFDAVFSNAALHWMLDTAGVASSISRALKPGGRLVLECGGQGNIRTIEEAVAAVFREQELPLPTTRTVFRSIGTLSTALETAGLEVREARLFDRPTRLEGDDGIDRWLQQFAAYYFADLTRPQQEAMLAAVAGRLRPTLYRDGAWWADYRRLRLTAFK